MNFQVPQFIEVEDKIFGPLTFKQFIYLAGGGGIAFLFYVYLPLVIAIIPIVGVVILSLALAFYKVNNRPFIKVIESGVGYLFGPKMYIWRKSEPKKKPGEIGPIYKTGGDIKKVNSKRLEDLAWSLDVKERIN